MLLTGVLSMTRVFASPVEAAQNTKRRILFGVGLAAGLWAGFAHAQMILPGKFDVGQGGSASYTIPITVVPGTSGMEPKLALSYDSQGGNGLAGVGWSFSGLSVITRCPRTIAQDSVTGGTNYDANDRFCLDGQRLNVIAGVYGADGSEYRTEREEFSRVMATGVLGSGPASFTVQTKSGLTMEFGATTNSQIIAKDALSVGGVYPVRGVRIWAVNKITDAAGNYMTMSYNATSANGEYRPEKIEYTGNSAAGLLPSASVELSYETRPDKVKLYQSGTAIPASNRIYSIRVLDGTTQVRAYRLTYDAGVFTGRSRLTSVKQCLSDVVDAVCMPATAFTWSDRQKTFPAQVSWGTAFSQNDGWNDESKNPRYLVDIDGDGKSDALGFAKGGVYVSKSSGASVPAYTRWTTQYDSDNWNNKYLIRTLADVNGDGKPDIVGFAWKGLSGNGIIVSLANATGTGFLAPAIWGQEFLRVPEPSSPYPNYWDTDVPAAVKYTYNVTEGDGGENGSGCSCTYPVTAYYTDNEEQTPRYMADVNGDGRADVVGFGAKGVWVSLSTGSSFGAKTKWTSQFGFTTYGLAQKDYAKKTPKRFMADMNGDGLADVVEFSDTGVWVALSTGTAFGTRTQWSANFPGYWDDKTRVFTLGDFNGDGLPDVVSNTSSGVSVAINTGTKLLAAAVWSPEFALEGAVATNPSTYKFNWNDPNKYPIQFVDVNGDGMADVVGFGGNGTYVALSTGSSFEMKAAAAQGRWSAEFGYNSTPQAYQSENIGPRRLADVNGDGMVDIVGFAYGLQVAASTGIPADLMTAITTGIGHKTDISYISIAQPGAPYTKNTDAVAPMMDFQAPIHVVSEVRIPNGVNTTPVLTRYWYAGAKTNTKGRGFAGFTGIASWDDATQLYEARGFLTEFPYTGMQVGSQKFYAPGGVLKTLLDQTSNAFDVVPLNGGKSQYVRMTGGAHLRWDLKPDGTQGFAYPIVYTSYTYDEWGNTIDTYEADPTGFWKNTHNEYEPTVTTADPVTGKPRWILGRLKKATVTNVIPAAN